MAMNIGVLMAATALLIILAGATMKLYWLLFMLGWNAL